MHYSTSSLLTILAAQSASATLGVGKGLAGGLSLGFSAVWDINAMGFSTPAGSNNNQCNDNQKGGYDFNDLPPGPVPDNYGGCKWKGFAAKKVTMFKRGGKVSSVNNCISGTLDAKADAGPAFGYSAGFSLSGFQISTDYDTDVEAHYAMPGGETCKQTIKCGKDAKSYNNNQCGGATSVTYKQPSTATKSCGISVYSMTFDCSTQSKTKPPSPPTPTATSVSPPGPPSMPPSPPSPPTTYVQTTPAVQTTPRETTTMKTMTPPAETTPVAPPTPMTTAMSSTTTVIYSTYAPPSSPGLNFPNTTMTTTMTIMVPPSSPSPPSPPQGPPSPPEGPPSPPSPPAGPPSPPSPPSGPPSPPSPPAGPPSPPAGTPSPPQTPVGCPGVVPKCLNTWMWESGCSNNADASCYCKNSKFIADVLECIGCWSGSCEEKSAGVSYLAGICAQDLPSNGFMFNVPQCATLAPTPPAVAAPTSTPPAESTPSAPASSAMESASSSMMTTSPAAEITPAPTPSAPVPAAETTIIVSTIYTCPATDSMGSTVPGSTLTSTIMTTVTVPAISFSTQSTTAAGETPSVGLYPPAPAPATTTTSPAAAETSAPASGAEGEEPAPSSGNTYKPNPGMPYATPSTTAQGIPAAVGTAPPTRKPSSSVAPFTGAASAVSAGGLVMLLPAVAAGVLALLG